MSGCLSKGFVCVCVCVCLCECCNCLSCLTSCPSKRRLILDLFHLLKSKPNLVYSGSNLVVGVFGEASGAYSRPAPDHMVLESL